MKKRKIKCPNCFEFFNLNKKDEKLLLEAISKKQKLVMVECPNCYKTVPINPMDLSNESIESNPEEVIQCPICHDGIVCYIDEGDEKFWGCGECGNVWFSKKGLDDTIAKSKYLS